MGIPFSRGLWKGHLSRIAQTATSASISENSLPHLGPKELKINGNQIQNTGISLVDLMNVLGADGWEVVEVAVAEIGRMTYVLKRPTG
jgi:hypothetical protein